MKVAKIVINALKNGIHIISIIAVFIILLQLKQCENNTQLAIEESEQEIAKQEKTIENTNNVEIYQRTQNQITSRNSVVRRKSENIEEVEESKQEIVEEVIEEQYSKIEDITISRDMDLTVRTGLSKEDFKNLISNVKYDTSKFFYDNSDFIYDLCVEYQINEIFFCGLISAESGWNIASNHRRAYNYISLMTKKGLIQYNSVEEGLTAAAEALHNNYLTEGGRFYNGKTLYGVKTRFCPASSTWVELVYGRMQQIINCK